MSMSLRVYAVRPDGTTTVVREQREILPADHVPTTLQYPPCACPRCGAAEDER
ncbi:hypothetical protein [Streptomyces fradiae]|uniref:hypothetical protein n=1 Tax=Streptomyces fradiae TaxID=1906 RepID=UPI002943F0FD|nr:hypothetical protein [Streptomyces fradiae]WOI58591.1 hypothetical protein RYQ63_00825 [Streptomyces fradiae]